AKKYRRTICVISLLAATTQAAWAQDDSGSKSESTEKPASAEFSASDFSRPTLEELKAAGTHRSIYRKPQLHSVKTETPKPQLEAFKNGVEPVLKRACFECHGPDAQEGNVRIDTWNPDLLNGNDVNWWLEVLAVLSKGEMPPAEAAKLEDKDRSKVLEWLTSEIQVASTLRRAQQGKSSFRRITRYEYSYTLQDLLGLPYDFAKDLPPESASEDGFLNSSEMLHMSPIQFETFRELSHKALKKATVTGERPDLIYWGISMKAASAVDWSEHEKQLEKVRQEHKDDPEKLKQELERKVARKRGRPNSAHYLNLATDQTVNASWSYPGGKYAWKPATTRPELPTDSEIVAIIPPKRELIIELGDTIPEEGMLRVRVRASYTNIDENRFPSLQLELGWQATNDSQASVRISDHDLVIDAAPDNPQFYSWDVPLSEIYPRNSMRKTWKMGDLPSPSEYVKLVNSSVSQGDIQIDYVEITAPLYEQWPPQSHTRIFMDSENRTDEAVYAREVLTKFMSRAWRRHLTNLEVDQKMALFEKIFAQCGDFEEAMIEVLATVLSSPQFLYLVRLDQPSQTNEVTSSERLSDFELATRLSMFLWCSTPDDELLSLASNRQLNHRLILMGQVERMLADPRSRRFTKHFVRQWLGMQLLDFLHVDQKTYPGFDPALKEAMQEEPVAFVYEVMQKNHSVLDF
ncbi:MAG: DUF1592 domain-containing protein, partial [Pirellula staleyi]